MKSTMVFILAEVLDHLGIDFKEFPCGNGAFYYCMNPAGGYTFDLQCDEDNVIRLWRFIGTAPSSKAGKQYEYRKPHYQYAAIGMEVTDEGDVSFYAEQKIDPEDSNKQKRITRMIEGYVSMIINMNFKWSKS